MRAKYALAAIFAVLLAVPAQAAQCPNDMVMCAKGANGSGGCYRPGYAECFGGAVCSSGMRYCAAGSKGSGGCYRIGYRECHDGAIR